MPESRRDLLCVAGMLSVAIGTLSYGHGHPAVTTAIVGALALSTMLVWRDRPDLVLGATGLLVGPVVEVAATRCGLWTYTSPSIAGLPLWVLPMWWIYPVAVTRVAMALTGQRPSRASLPLSVGLILLVVPWLCLFGAARPGLALAGTIILMAAFLRRHHTWTDLVTLVICGVIGPGAEILPVTMGAWTYPQGGAFVLPIWLPTGYGVFGAALIHLAMALVVRAPRGQARSQSTGPHNSPTLQPS